LDHLPQEQQQELRKLLGEFKDVLNQVPGRADVDPVVIQTTAPYPLAQKPYHLPHAKEEAVRKEVQDLLKQGIIRPSKSPWASPVVIVAKKNGRIRLCVDFRRLNAVTVTDNFPIPNMETLLEKASRSKLITTLDLVKGFHQVPVDKSSIPKTSFVLPFGKYEYVRMPFGIKNGPSHFQRITTALLANSSSSDCYIDDIVVYSETFAQHLRDLQEVLSILRQHGLTASPEKANFCKSHLDFLGHKIGEGKISPQEAKVKALRSFQRPTTKKGVRSFLGATGYYRKFIKDYSKIATPLFVMTSKKAPDKPIWTTEQDQAFQTLRRALTEESFLVSPDFSKPFVLATDASTTGLGAVLSQVDEAGDERPIAYFSRRLKKYQLNYTVTELELLAVVAAVEHFSAYLTGTKFHIQTDHRALQYLESLKAANSRLARWAMFLQGFDFTIAYRPGPSNSNADCLS